MLKIEQVLRNENGENVLKDYFDKIILKKEYIIVKKNDLIGVYNKKNFSQILKCEWDKVIFDRGYIVASCKNHIGVFDVLGYNILNSFAWDNVKLFDKGVVVTRYGKQGFFKYDGTMILDCIWKRIEPYNQVLLAYRGNGAKCIRINYDGSEKH